MAKKEKKVSKDKDSREVLLLKEQLARALADYDNLKKRLEKEHLEIEKVILGKLTARILPILDMLKKIQEHLGDAGLAIAIGEFESTLKDEGIIKIEAGEGEEFNEEYHEAVETVSGTHDGKIAEIIEEGYQVSGGPVIRYVKVKVTRKGK